MADLKSLFGTKKDKANEEAKPQAVESPAGAGQPDAAGEAEAVESTASDAAKPKLAGLNFVKVGGTVPARPATIQAAAVQPVREEDLSLDSLDDLEQLDVSSIPESATPSGFADETPATAPIRELPEDMDKTMKQFVDLIDGVYQIIHEPDILGNVIKSIMIELKSNPQYAKLIAPEDVRTWIRAMRDSMGLAKIQKAEKKAKSPSAKKSAKVDNDMLADLQDLGISFD